MRFRFDEDGAESAQRGLGLLVQCRDVESLIAEHGQQGDVADGVDHHVPATGVRDGLPERALPGESDGPARDAQAGGGDGGEGIRVNARVGTGVKLGRHEQAVAARDQRAGYPRYVFPQVAHFGDKILAVHLPLFLSGVLIRSGPPPSGLQA